MITHLICRGCEQVCAPKNLGDMEMQWQSKEDLHPEIAKGQWASTQCEACKLQNKGARERPVQKIVFGSRPIQQTLARSAIGD